MTATPAPVEPLGPGWYADPFGRLPYRWWDGRAWTAYAADAEVQWDPTPVDEAERPAPGVRGLGVAVAGMVIGVALALAAAGALVAAGRPGGRTVEVPAVQAGLWSGLLGACLYVSRRRGTRSFARDFGWRFRWGDVGIGVVASLAARLVSGIVVAPVPLPFRRVDVPERSVLEDTAEGAAGWAVLVILVCVGAPVVEELFFRGLVQTRLVGRLGPAAGIAVTSVLFGAAHLTAWQGSLTFVYALAVAGGGLVLGTVRHYTGRLGAAVLAHAFFNAQAVLAIALLS